jgi:hypothetical protein
MRSPFLAADRSVNLYLDELPAQRGTYVLLSMPGLRPLALLPSAPVRALYQSSVGRTFAVTSTTLFELFQGGSFTARGTVPTGTNPVSLIDDGIHLVLSVEGVGLAMPFATNVLATLPLTGPQSWGRLGYLDGRVLTHEPGTSRFWYTDILAATTWPALNFYAAEARPDPLVTLYVDARTLYLLGRQSTEVWYPTGDALNPFARNQSSFIEQGTEAPAAVTAANNALYWLGGSARGEGPIWRLAGATPERVSTQAIESAMATMSTVGDCIATPVSWAGHSFILWYFPTGGQTWLYDTTLQSWCELVDLAADGTQQAYRCYTHAYSAGEHVLGDRTTGDLYVLDASWYHYGTAPLYRERVSPHVRNDQQRLTYQLFELVMDTGVGLDGAPAVGADPQVQLSWSDDGGRQWSYPLWRSAGKIGERTRLVRWRRLGQCRSGQRTFRCVVTDPVPVSILGARVEVA